MTWVDWLYLTAYTLFVVPIAIGVTARVVAFNRRAGRESFLKQKARYPRRFD